MLEWDQIKRDNPHFIGNDKTMEYYEVGDGVWFCDITIEVEDSHGGIVMVKESYERLGSGRWVLIRG